MKVLVEENPRILIVDDDASIIESYRKILCVPKEDELGSDLASLAGRLFNEPVEPAPKPRQGYRLKECLSGEEALVAVEQAVRNKETFSVIFLDFTLPGLDGIETAIKIRQLDPSVELVLVTGRSDLNVELLSQDVPPINKFFYFQKPFNSGELRHLTRALTEKWKTERELETLKNNLEELVEQRTQELTQANARLAKARDVAESAVQAKRDFLATMSHEMRTPLNAILGFAELVMSQNIPDDTHEYVENIYGAGCDLLTIVTDILDFSNLARGKVRFDMDAVAVAPLIEHIYQQFVGSARAKGLQLGFEIARECNREISTSAWGLRRILENLVSNAVKFTKSGRVDIQLSQDQDAQGRDCLQFAVQDTGIGIADEMKSHVFSAFSQVDSSTSRRYDGVGLGLAICEKVFRAIGCEFGFESELHAGSRFWFKIPLCDYPPAKATDTVSTAPQAPVHQEAAVREPDDVPAILIVEDNDVNQLIMLNIVKHHGCKADVVANGLEALRQIEQRDYRLIFMDCQMPEMDGIEATRAIRNMHISSEQTAIIAVTANASEENKTACKLAGMDGHISKPIAVDTIRGVLQKYGLTQAAQ